MTKALIFDFDGTLVQSNFLKKNTFLRLLKKYKNEEFLKKLLDQKLPRGKLFLEFFRKVGMTSDDIKKNADLYTKKYNHLVDSKIVDMEPINGVYELFSLGFKSFINSATPEENIKNIISAKGWDIHFTNVYGSPLSKEENFKKMRKEYSLYNHEIYVIGDGQDDEEYALSLSLNFLPVGNYCDSKGNNPFSLIEIYEILSK